MICGMINVATTGVAISSLSSFSISTTSLTRSDIIVSITFITAEAKKKWTVLLCVDEVAKSSSRDDPRHAPDWWLILVSPWCPSRSKLSSDEWRRTEEETDRPSDHQFDELEQVVERYETMIDRRGRVERERIDRPLSMSYCQRYGRLIHSVHAYRISHQSHYCSHHQT